MQTKPLILALLAGVAVSGAAQAALFDRGGGLIYDDVLNITWLQDANLAATNTFGVSDIDASGLMGWYTAASSWIAAMNTAEYLGYDDWRLPTVSPINGTAFNYGYSTTGTTDFGYNISAPGTTYAGGTGSELAYMYYNNLGNKGWFDTVGNSEQAGWGLTNTGPFANLQSYVYWSGLEYAPNWDLAWGFNTDGGTQDAGYRGNGSYAWAVRPGDVAAPIPEPETYVLLLAGLGLVGWAARRRRR